MSSKASASATPRIVIGETDAQRLSGLALRAESNAPEVAQLLLDELERAQVLPDQKVPEDVVVMDSTVEFIDTAHDRKRVVKLVYPAEADISANRISVLTPIGAGLIGLRSGQSILWPDRDGRQRELQIIRVTRNEPSAA